MPIAACNVLADMLAGTASIAAAAEAIKKALGRVFRRSEAALSLLLPAERMEGTHVGAAESRQRLRGGCRPAVFARAVTHGHAAASRGAAGACVVQRWSIARAQGQTLHM